MRLFSRVSIASLAVFRTGFGLLVCEAMLRALWSGRVRENFELATFHFHYYGLEWLRPLPCAAMSALVALLALFGLMIAAGAWYRWAAALFAAGYTYIFLLEEANYLNHSYLICLFAISLAIVPAHRALSVDAWRKPRLRSSTVPAWCLWLVRFHIALPYFFGGVAKLSRDWLHGQPMQYVLAGYSKLALVGPWLAAPWAKYLFSWGGLVFDLTIVPAIAWRKSRPLALPFLVAFHLSNAFMFPIGVFPWMMLVGTTLLFEPDWPLRFSALVRRMPPAERSAQPTASARARRAISVAFGAYVALHLVLPFRHLLYDGDVNWHEQGQQFAWRMMTRHKEGYVRFYARDPATGESVEINPAKLLTPRQKYQMEVSPERIRQFSRNLADLLSSKAGHKIEMHVDSWASVNGRAPERMIDPKIDLAAVMPSLASARWILPMTQKLPE